jgi:hypothetical protein
MRQALAAAMITVATSVALVSTASHAAVATPDAAAPGVVAVGPEAAAGDTTGRTPFTLPHKTYKRADGSVDTVADPKAVAALRAAQLVDGGCGYVCDGKDPNSYVWNGSTCNDALTIYRHDEGWAYAELRFSGRCATAWTRTCCYARAGGFGYASNGAQRSSVFNFSGVYTGSPIWTAMLYDYGTLRYKACFDRVVAGSPSEWACTDPF